MPSQKEEKIYNHLETSVQQETPEKVIQRYSRLFVEATGYEDKEIRTTLEELIKNNDNPAEFCSFLNHCCYIAINHWLTTSPETQVFIPELVAIFADIPPFARFQSPSSRRIRERVTAFSKSEYFLKMERLRKLLGTDEVTQRDKSEPLGTLLGRYPFLYQDCVIPKESYPQTKAVIKAFQKEQERNFELSLSSYIMSQLRIARLAKRYGSLTQAQEAVPSTANPTLLKDHELISTLQHFISGIQGQSTYQDLANRFILHSSKAERFKTYKKDLYEYLTSTLENNYAKKQFNPRLGNYLKQNLTDWDGEKPNEQLILRLTNNLLKFLVVESRQKIDHYLYLDLVTNLGPTVTIGLLLKIFLISKKNYPYLTSRFAILYSHYENTPRHNVHWLFKSLENFKIALTIHTGAIDVSYWRSVNSISDTGLLLESNQVS